MGGCLCLGVVGRIEIEVESRRPRRATEVAEEAAGAAARGEWGGRKAVEILTRATSTRRRSSVVDGGSGILEEAPSCVCIV